MATDREARALGAGASFTVEGKDYTFRPVVALNLCDLEREALKHYKRQYLETHRDNLDCIPEAERSAYIREKLEEVATWDVGDLPQKIAYDCRHIPLEGKGKKQVIAWIEKNQGEAPDTDNGILAALVTALDNGTITVREVYKMTCKRPRVGKVRWDQWWVTGSVKGQISFITSSLKQDHPDITSATVEKWPILKLMEAARLVESITSASLGNG